MPAGGAFPEPFDLSIGAAFAIRRASGAWAGGSVRLDPSTMLRDMPCRFPTAGASASTPVVCTYCLASSGVVSAPPLLDVASWISDPVPMSPISPSTKIAGLTSLRASIACLVCFTFSSKGNEEMSKTIELNSA
jgi:hypothetical protein